MHHTGTVKDWTDKGFGFITDAKDGKEYFIHIKELHGVEGLIKDETVGFEIRYDSSRGKYQACKCWSYDRGDWRGQHEDWWDQHQADDTPNHYEDAFTGETAEVPEKLRVAGVAVRFATQE